MSASNWIKVLRLVATVVILGSAVAYVGTHGSQLEILGRVSFGEAGALIIAMTVAFVVIAYTFYLLVSMLKTELRPIEWIGLTFLSNALNYVGPTRPGALAKATYLKKRTAMAYSRFSSVLAANVFFFLFFSAVIGLVLLIVQWPTDRGAWFLGTTCITLLGVTSAPLLLPLYRFRREGRLFHLLNNAVQGFEEIRSQRLKILEVGAAVLAQHALSATCCLIAFRALGFEIDWLIALTLVVFASIANAFSITPSNIGVQEMVMAYVYKIVGMSFADGLLAAGLIRAAHILVTFVGAPFFTWLLLDSAKLRLSSLTSATDLTVERLVEGDVPNGDRTARHPPAGGGEGQE